MSLSGLLSPYPECQNEARDIVFLMDGSSSMRASEFMQLKVFIALIMKSIPHNAQVSRGDGQEGMVPAPRVGLNVGRFKTNARILAIFMCLAAGHIPLG